MLVAREINACDSSHVLVSKVPRRTILLFVPDIRGSSNLQICCFWGVNYQITNLRNYAIASSALPLFMFRVLADHAHHALAVHDLALVADFLDRCPNLHNDPQLLASNKNLSGLELDD